MIWTVDNRMDHVREAPHHLQTQGKIERWHQTLKNRILLDNCYLSGGLKERIAAFVSRYKHARYHEILSNATPAGVILGRARGDRIKRMTITNRRLRHRR